MDYDSTIAWMFSQLPMYQQQGAAAYKKDLSRTLLFSKHLNQPENKFKSIHIGGTNGKGSTAHMVAAILQKSGYKVGLYTSPHLKDFRERIRINGELIPETDVVNFIESNAAFLTKNQLSFFEMTVGMAFDFFAKKEVDFAVVEVGLGGRLDSTNIIIPEVSVITNIGLDHTQFLGETLQEIALEKAGIIKTNVPVVIGETQQETSDVFKAYAQEKDADIYFADQEDYGNHNCSLLGDYQKKNIKTVLKTIEIMTNKGVMISEDDIKQGLSNIQQLTGLRGRWEVLQNHPKIICDTAHNKEGLSLVMAQLGRERFQKLHFVLGLVKDKNLTDLVHLFPKNAQYYFCKPQIERGLEVEKLLSICRQNKLNGQAYSSVDLAFAAAKQQASKNDLIFVGGSTFVVAEVL